MRNSVYHVKTCGSSSLSVALGVLAAAVPGSSLGTAAAVAVCFSPEEDCTALTVDAINTGTATRAVCVILAIIPVSNVPASKASVGMPVSPAMMFAAHR